MLNETHESAGMYDVTERLQADHYDKIAQDYALHYGDRYSQEYRRRFINEPMFEGIELKGATVLEAMCGSGETTAYLLERGARVIGMDVSPSEIEKFKARFPKAEGLCSSIFATELEDESIDCVAVVGGLHHLHPHLSDAVREIHRVLKKGGAFCFAEPHTGTIVDSMRRVWYRHDDLFADNEEAIDIGALKKEFGSMFETVHDRYTGNIGYLFVLNSMVFRIPLSVKKFYSPLFLTIENVVQKFQGPKLSCIAVSQWRKV